MVCKCKEELFVRVRMTTPQLLIAVINAKAHTGDSLSHFFLHGKVTQIEAYSIKLLSTFWKRRHHALLLHDAEGKKYASTDCYLY